VTRAKYARDLLCDPVKRIKYLSMADDARYTSRHPAPRTPHPAPRALRSQLQTLSLHPPMLP